MSTVTIASGLGATATAKAQATWGGDFMTTGQRTLIFDTAKLTFDPHVVQGGPYLAAGQLAALGASRVLTWTDAKVTLAGTMFNTADALLLACALGTTATMTQLGTTTAYELGGASGTTGSAPDKSSSWLDLQLGIPSLPEAILTPFNFSSGVIQKAEWKFDRTGLVSKSYDMIYQQVASANPSTILAATEPYDQVPFNMATTTSDLTGSAFAVGTYNSEAIIPGLRTVTITLTRTLASEADRMYGGYEFQQSPVTSGYVDLAVAVDADYTDDAASEVFANLLSGDSTSLIAQAIGNEIGSSGHNDTFKLQIPAWYIDTGGEPNLDGPTLIKNTPTGKGLISPAGDPWLNCVYISGDSMF